MATRYIRHKPSGSIFVWQEAFAYRDDFEDVEPQVEAPPAPVEPARRPTLKMKKSINDEALSVDASRRLP